MCTFYSNSIGFYNLVYNRYIYFKDNYNTVWEEGGGQAETDQTGRITLQHRTEVSSCPSSQTSSHQWLTGEADFSFQPGGGNRSQNQPERVGWGEGMRGSLSSLSH